MSMGVLCTPCHGALSISPGATPEQIRGANRSATSAGLVDAWGRIHPLDAVTLIGRHVASHGLAIRECSISRHHARIELAGPMWTIEDLGSANGTFVDSRPVTDIVALRHGSCVKFGEVELYFLAHVPPISIAPLAEVQTRQIPCIRAEGSGPFNLASLTGTDPHRSTATSTAPPLSANFSLEIYEPSGGGGGFVEVDGRRAQLSLAQFELLSLLMRRTAQGASQPPALRGFVRAAELVEALPWDTLRPTENNVKQVLRRLRRVLLKLARRDLIESRHRSGYRLRAIPCVEPAPGQLGSRWLFLGGDGQPTTAELEVEIEEPEPEAAPPATGPQVPSPFGVTSPG